MVAMTKDKEICLSVFIPSPEGLGGGGAEEVVLRLARGFKEKGFNVDLVLLKSGGVFLTKVHPEVRLVDLGVKPKKPRRTLRKLLALMHYFRKEQPTVFFSISDTDNVAMWAKRLSGTSTQVVTVLQLPLSEPLRWMKTRLKRFLTLFSYRWVDGIVASSRGVAEDLAEVADLDVQDIKVIYNPMVLSDILEKAKEPVDHPWFAPDQPPVILGTGRLAKQKDFKTLIRAFALVRQQRSARLIIIGEGALRAELEALIQELGLVGEIDLPGFQMNPYAYMAQSAVFVLSSIFEGFGNVLVEAMTTGTPVVSTNCKSGPAEILVDGEYGKLVPIKDPQALADAIIATLDHPISSEVLQQRARCFSLEKIVNQYLEAVRLF